MYEVDIKELHQFWAQLCNEYYRRSSHSPEEPFRKFLYDNYGIDVTLPTTIRENTHLCFRNEEHYFWFKLRYM